MKIALAGVAAERAHSSRLWEPRVAPIAITIPHKAVKADLDDGGKLKVLDPAAVVDATVRLSSVGTQVAIPFDLPKRVPT